MSTDMENRVEELLQRPCWVIDFLPCRVPADGRGAYFAVEKYLREGEGMAAFRSAMAKLLLKLYCYDGFQVLLDGGERCEKDPAPEKLNALISDPDQDVLILLETERSMIMLSRGDLCASVYDPSEKLLSLLRPLSNAAGLFLWQAEDSAE